MDFTGCGNTLNMPHPRVLQLIMDSLRYWVTEMHVDGFRFDLASTLARELFEVDQLGAFFDIIHQDPILSQVKLIAEPWDVGEGGYQVGNFPGALDRVERQVPRQRPPLLEGRRRHGLRVRHPAGRHQRPLPGRRPQPYASINFITCHDGFTLQDLVSYNEKHNEANGEENRDGANDNNSWNCGVEGPTDDPAIIELRERQKRNSWPRCCSPGRADAPAAATSWATPRRATTTPTARTTSSPGSTGTWTTGSKQFLEFVQKRDLHLAEQPVFQRRKFFQGRAIRGSDIKDISFFSPSGQEMSDEDWNAGFVKCLGVRLAGDLIDDVDERGEPIVGETLLILLNAH